MKTLPRFSSSDNAEDLLQFSGTEQYFKNQSMPDVVYTDGVKHLLETRECYWLGQLIVSNYKWNTLLKDQPFITCELTTDSSEGTVVFTDGNDTILYEEKIPFTDFPDKGVSIWLVDGVLLLPSEY